MVEAGRPADGKAIHVLSSGLKAAATWTRVQTMQDCREVGAWAGMCARALLCVSSSVPHLVHVRGAGCGSCG